MQHTQTNEEENNFSFSLPYRRKQGEKKEEEKRKKKEKKEEKNPPFEIVPSEKYVLKLVPNYTNTF